MQQQVKRRMGRPATQFGLKEYPPKSFALTSAAKKILSRAALRARQSESNVVELLARRHGNDVRAADFLLAVPEETAG